MKLVGPPSGPAGFFVFRGRADGLLPSRRLGFWVAEMRPWLFHALAAVALWGLWGFFGKSASRSMGPESLMLLGSLGGVLVFPVYLSLFPGHFRFVWHDLSSYLAVAAGMTGSLGALFYYFALSRGEVSRVVFVTAAYPVVTVILAWAFLREPLTLQKSVGMLLVLAGVYLLAR